MVWLIFGAVIAVIATPIVVERLRKHISPALRAEAPGRYTNLSQGVTHYQWAGPPDGQIVVCVHGLSTPSYVMTALVKGFVLMGFRVLSYDLYGRGLSARPQGDQDLPFFRQQLAELLEDQGVDGPITLVGYSMGGSISVDFASTYPEKVHQIILLATAGLGQKISPVTRFLMIVPVVGDALMNTFGGFRYGRSTAAMDAAIEAAPNMKPWPVRECRSQGFLPAVLSSYRHTLTVQQDEAHRTISENDIAVLAIWGAEDPVVPMTAMGRLAQANRTSRQTVVPGADHSVIYTHPQDVIRDIQEFLRAAD
ncbi:alpha/beta fold hydrolase [Falsihalocynthiibacter sp. SS001]|uniref:alpha/beta fold hydrolase n=1 Tax=Falsihalocynthiibacter sp. SS001 TaxID=3349698 RepID=UPI0036D25C45